MRVDKCKALECDLDLKLMNSLEELDMKHNWNLGIIYHF